MYKISASQFLKITCFCANSLGKGKKNGGKCDHLPSWPTPIPQCDQCFVKKNLAFFACVYYIWQTMKPIFIMFYAY